MGVMEGYTRIAGGGLTKNGSFFGISVATIAAYRAIYPYPCFQTTGLHNFGKLRISPHTPLSVF